MLLLYFMHAHEKGFVAINFLHPHTHLLLLHQLGDLERPVLQEERGTAPRPQDTPSCPGLAHCPSLRQTALARGRDHSCTCSRYPPAHRAPTCTCQMPAHKPEKAPGSAPTPSCWQEPAPWHSRDSVLVIPASLVFLLFLCLARAQLSAPCISCASKSVSRPIPWCRFWRPSVPVYLPLCPTPRSVPISDRPPPSPNHRCTGHLLRLPCIGKAHALPSEQRLERPFGSASPAARGQDGHQVASFGLPSFQSQEAAALRGGLANAGGKRAQQRRDLGRAGCPLPLASAPNPRSRGHCLSPRAGARLFPSPWSCADMQSDPRATAMESRWFPNVSLLHVTLQMFACYTGSRSCGKGQETAQRGEKDPALCSLSWSGPSAAWAC